MNTKVINIVDGGGIKVSCSYRTFGLYVKKSELRSYLKKEIMTLVL
jgi:hypothetical protein